VLQSRDPKGAVFATGLPAFRKTDVLPAEERRIDRPRARPEHRQDRARLHERLSLQARAVFFNIFDHPNFCPPTNYLSSPLFGQSTQMPGASLGSGGQNGGLNPLYQIGARRSVQLALKLLF
jgi:hypothetical protein